MQLADLSKDIYQEYNKSMSAIYDVTAEFESFILTIINEKQKNIEASKKRNQLAANIIAKPERLLTSRPGVSGLR